MDPLTEAVRQRLAGVRARILSTGRDLTSVTIVAVTKGFGVDAVRAARRVGFDDIGENYAQELLGKAREVGAEEQATGEVRPLRWHFLGAVQRNKVRQLAGIVALWQSVDRLAVGEEIARRAAGAPVLVEVNVTGEPQRAGCAWNDAPGLVAGLRALDLDVRGVMGVGSIEDPRPGFRRLAALAADLGLPQVSMGMTDDLEIALEEGATIVRVGRALFGARPPGTRVRR